MTNKSLAFDGRPDPAGSSEMPAASTFAIHDRAMAHKPDMEMVLRREIEALKLAAAWRPIETAPKDGTDVLIYDPTETPGVMSAYWTDSVWVGGGAWVQQEHRSDTYAFNPTHWMPLPEPPERTQSSVAK